MEFIKLFLFSIAFTSLVGCSAQQNHVQVNKNRDSNTTLWQVSGKDLKQPSYLFGTFHLLCKDDIHFSEELVKDVKSSKEIYMEMDMDDPSTMLSAVLYMNMKDGKKLSDLYSPKDFMKVKEYFIDTLHSPFPMLEKVKPYLLVALLYPRMMKCNTPSGVEEELMKVAKENKKDIQGFETMAYQASIFDSIPYEWQAKELMKNIDSFPFYKRQLDTMTTAYKNQQLDEMSNFIGKSEFGSDEYQNLLLDNRNKAWVKKLVLIMPSESVFVAVGAGHLGGKSGLISLLKQQGYIVEPLNNK